MGTGELNAGGLLRWTIASRPGGSTETGDKPDRHLVCMQTTFLPLTEISK